MALGKEDYFLFLPSATSYILTLVAIGPGQICVSKNNRRQFSNKDFPRGQANGFADNLDFEKLNVGQTKK